MILWNSFLRCSSFHFQAIYTVLVTQPTRGPWGPFLHWIGRMFSPRRFEAEDWKFPTASSHEEALVSKGNLGVRASCFLLGGWETFNDHTIIIYWYLKSYNISTRIHWLVNDTFHSHGTSSISGFSWFTPLPLLLAKENPRWDPSKWAQD